VRVSLGHGLGSPEVGNCILSRVGVATAHFSSHVLERVPAAGYYSRGIKEIVFV
jgi:hypothetical protein